MKKPKARIPGTSSINKNYTPIPAPVIPKKEVDKDEHGNQLFFGGKLDQIEGDTSKTTPSKNDRDAYKLACTRSLKTLNQPLNPKPTTNDTSLPKIPKIQFGKHTIDTWFAAPYPLEFTNLSTLYICEFCLKYMNSVFTLERHLTKCVHHSPPGDEIYRQEQVSIYEVDGRKNKVCRYLI